jgi:hypothetical protein
VKPENYCLTITFQSALLSCTQCYQGYSKQGHNGAMCQ